MTFLSDNGERPKAVYTRESETIKYRVWTVSLYICTGKVDGRRVIGWEGQHTVCFEGQGLFCNNKDLDQLSCAFLGSAYNVQTASNEYRELIWFKLIQTNSTLDILPLLLDLRHSPSLLNVYIDTVVVQLPSIGVKLLQTS